MLTQAEAARRLAARGPSRPPASSRSASSIVRANVLTLFNAILAVAGAAILLVGDPRDALFLGILVANTAIGITQELRAKRELDRLAALVAPTATVVRDDVAREVPVGEVVVDDLIRAGAGDQIVADGVVEPGEHAAIDESILSGESASVERGPGDEVRSGSFVVEGSLAYVASAVGADSYAERIADVARTFRHPRSPLELGLNRLLTVLVISMVPLGLVLAVALLARESDSLQETVSTAVAALVILVPEGLMLLASLTAAAAAVKMARRGALVQQLNGVESLASVDAMCLDKTGTLTRPDLRVERVVPMPGVDEDELRADIAALAAATRDRNRTMDALHQAFPASPPVTVAEVPFSSRRRWSAIERADGGTLLLGAPELFGLGPLEDEVRESTRSGRRVVAVAAGAPGLQAPAADGPPPAAQVRGVAVLAEQLRDDARETVGYLREQGVDLLILSGDAPATAGAIARDAGVDGDVRAIDGRDLPQDADALDEVLAGTSVIGRISPEDKRRVVESLVARGRYVAMVGDGVNDVPALKAARLAVAQGTGTQMARGVADVVLVQGDFSAVPPMVGEGRTILRNVQRVARLFVTKSVFAAVMIIAFAVVGFDYPFLPRQLSLAATLTIGVPAFFLALAPSSGPWRPDGLVREIARFAVPAGLTLALGVLVSYLLAIHAFGEDTADARTVATTTLVAVGLGFVVALEGGPRRMLALVLAASMGADLRPRAGARVVARVLRPHGAHRGHAGRRGGGDGDRARRVPAAVAARRRARVSRGSAAADRPRRRARAGVEHRGAAVLLLAGGRGRIAAAADGRPGAGVELEQAAVGAVGADRGGVAARLALGDRGERGGDRNVGGAAGAAQVADAHAQAALVPAQLRRRPAGEGPAPGGGSIAQARAGAREPGDVGDRVTVLEPGLDEPGRAVGRVDGREIRGGAGRGGGGRGGHGAGRGECHGGGQGEGQGAGQCRQDLSGAHGLESFPRGQACEGARGRPSG